MFNDWKLFIFAMACSQAKPCFASIAGRALPYEAENLRLFEDEDSDKLLAIALFQTTPPVATVDEADMKWARQSMAYLRDEIPAVDLSYYQVLINLAYSHPEPLPAATTDFQSQIDGLLEKAKEGFHPRCILNPARHPLRTVAYDPRNPLASIPGGLGGGYPKIDFAGALSKTPPLTNPGGLTIPVPKTYWDPKEGYLSHDQIGWTDPVDKDPTDWNMNWDTACPEESSAHLSLDPNERRARPNNFVTTRSVSTPTFSDVPCVIPAYVKEGIPDDMHFELTHLPRRNALFEQFVTEVCRRGLAPIKVPDEFEGDWFAQTMRDFGELPSRIMNMQVMNVTFLLTTTPTANQSNDVSAIAAGRNWSWAKMVKVQPRIINKPEGHILSQIGDVSTNLSGSSIMISVPFTYFGVLGLLSPLSSTEQYVPIDVSVFTEGDEWTIDSLGLDLKFNFERPDLN